MKLDSDHRSNNTSTESLEWEGDGATTYEYICTSSESQSSTGGYFIYITIFTESTTTTTTSSSNKRPERMNLNISFGVSFVFCHFFRVFCILFSLRLTCFVYVYLISLLAYLSVWINFLDYPLYELWARTYTIWLLLRSLSLSYFFNCFCSFSSSLSLNVFRDFYSASFYYYRNRINLREFFRYGAFFQHLIDLYIFDLFIWSKISNLFLFSFNHWLDWFSLLFPICLTPKLFFASILTIGSTQLKGLFFFYYGNRIGIINCPNEKLEVKCWHNSNIIRQISEVKKKTDRILVSAERTAIMMGMTWTKKHSVHSHWFRVLKINWKLLVRPAESKIIVCPYVRTCAYCANVNLLKSVSSSVSVCCVCERAGVCVDAVVVVVWPEKVRQNTI